MKILLVQQDMGIRETDYALFPIGLTYIAAVLSDHKVKIFDPNTIPISQVNNRLREEINSFEPDVLGLSIRNIDTTNYRNQHVHFNTVQPMLQLARDIAPELLIIAGGPGFSFFAATIMKRVPEIDFGIYLEGEEAMPELLDNLDCPEKVPGVYYRKNQEVLFSGNRPLPDFSKDIMPDLSPDVIDMKNYLGPSYNIVGVQTKRGCALNCAYCGYPLLNGSKTRLRSPSNIVDQIESMVKEFGLQHFVFVDSVFNVPEDHAVKICNELIKRDLPVKFGVWCHIKGITVEFLELLQRAGAVQIDFSPDAATNKGLKALNKGFTVADIFKTIKAARQIKGVGFGFGFFTSLPGYTLLDTLKTILIPFRIQLALPGRGGGGISYIRIEPHTQLYQVALQEGLLDEQDDLLPKDEQELSRMFYRPASQKINNLVMDTFLGLMERVLKPSAVTIFRLLGRLSGRKSAYDQKTGFVAFQKKIKR